MLLASSISQSNRKLSQALQEHNHPGVLQQKIYPALSTDYAMSKRCSHLPGIQPRHKLVDLDASMSPFEHKRWNVHWVCSKRCECEVQVHQLHNIRTVLLAQMQLHFPSLLVPGQIKSLLLCEKVNHVSGFKALIGVGQAS